MADSMPQLRMGFSRFGDLAPPRPPSGYDLRTFRPGDEEAWVDILSAGEFGAWDRDRLDRMLDGERAPLPLEGIFFVTSKDRPVGTACAFLHQTENGEVPELGWVAVHPAYRGRGIGMQVCLAVLGFVRELGQDYTYLLTEDFRLAAIKTYLRLGFEPEMTDPSHPARWEGLRLALDAGQESRSPG